MAAKTGFGSFTNSVFDLLYQTSWHGILLYYNYNWPKISERAKGGQLNSLL